MPPVARYTRFVALSKHSLWGVAVLVVGIVVWVASDNSGENGSRMVFSHAEKTTQNLQNMMTHPHYQGVDAHDRPFTVIADKAMQVDADNVSLANIRADMTMASGSWVALNSGTGLLNTKTKKLALKGGVDMFYEGGYEFRSDHAQVDINQGNAYGDAPIEGQGPLGTLKANNFTVLNHGQVIRFNDSVRMTLYR